MMSYLGILSVFTFVSNLMGRFLLYPFVGIFSFVSFFIAGLVFKVAFNENVKGSIKIACALTLSIFLLKDVFSYAYSPVVETLLLRFGAKSAFNDIGFSAVSSSVNFPGGVVAIIAFIIIDIALVKRGYLRLLYLDIFSMLPALFLGSMVYYISSDNLVLAIAASVISLFIQCVIADFSTKDTELSCYNSVFTSTINYIVTTRWISLLLSKTMPNSNILRKIEIPSQYLSHHKMSRIILLLLSSFLIAILGSSGSVSDFFVTAVTCVFASAICTVGLKKANYFMKEGADILKKAIDQRNEKTSFPREIIIGIPEIIPFCTVNVISISVLAIPYIAFLCSLFPFGTLLPTGSLMFIPIIISSFFVLSKENSVKAFLLMILFLPLFIFFSSKSAPIQNAILISSEQISNLGNASWYFSDIINSVLYFLIKFIV